MDCELWRAAAEAPAATAKRLRALVPAGASVSAPVAAIVADVRERGDAAVLGYTSRFDLGGREAQPLRVEPERLAQAADALDPALRGGLQTAIANVRRVAEAGVREARTVTFEDGHEVTLREAPVDRAAVYVPGGRAPYPSTVIMGVVTASAAGVGDIAVCAPPAADGEIDPVVLAAAALTGAGAAYRMGGAQAIAALAYGTETVTPVDVIVGPGNLYVQEAKLQVAGQVGIDGFAGPSDLLAIAAAGLAAEPLLFDLLAQAEHGPGTIVVALSPDVSLLEALRARLGEAPDTGAVARLVEVASLESALELAQAFAPEHLQLLGPEAEALAERCTHAGCVFVGESGGTAFGDYVAGSNHVLPTGGAARFASSLSAGHFRRRFTEVRIGRAAPTLAPAGAAIADAEGFRWHAQSMRARVRENGR